jgi:hypothetical protein
MILNPPPTSQIWKEKKGVCHIVALGIYIKKVLS